ncbi:hypothetical protein AB0L63_24495 [Nocardia sp. NPDC051990]|uniref:hypothetical protein n=1 Tax=Nocardia sp. NPDC051990 TaxID=3155285 RepID=UPI0034291DD1
MPPDPAARTYLLLDAQGQPYRSAAAGQWGGHRRSKIWHVGSSGAKSRAKRFGGAGSTDSGGLVSIVAALMVS